MKRNHFLLIPLIAISVYANADVALKPGRWLVTSKSLIDGIDPDAQSKKALNDARSRIPSDHRAEFDRMMAEQGAGADDSQEYECIKSEYLAIAAKDYMTKIMRDMNEGSQSCAYSDQHADAEKISYKFECGSNAQGGRSKGQVQMDFKETSYHMEATGSVGGPTQTGKKGEKQMVSRSISDGKWVSAICQPGDIRGFLGAGAHGGE